MHIRGFEEKQAAFAEQSAGFAGDPSGLVGQVRRFGEEGPAYEVLRIVNSDEACISVICSEEELAYPIAQILGDPIAETIP